MVAPEFPEFETNPRQPGSMVGEIWIADDFDTLPPDIAEAFGMQDLPYPPR